MSQLLTRLEDEIATGTDSVESAIASARAASYLARVGRYSESSQIILRLRSEYGDGHNGLVTVWMMLAEGLLGLFEKLSPAAFDRVRRAQFLAMALGDKDAIAVTSAWKAHIEFEYSQFKPMSESLKLALANAQDKYHDAQARVAMILSNAYYHLGDRRLGQQWFMQSRDYLLRDGDHVGIEALLCNRAAFNIARLRARSCFEPVPEELLKAARSELNSARNLQNLSNDSALPHLEDLCDARLLILEGRWRDAMARLISIRNAGPFPKYSFDPALIDLEVSYCSSQIEESINSIETSSYDHAHNFSFMDADDQLVAAWISRQLAAKANRSDLFERLDVEFNSCADRYEESMKTLSNALEPFLGA